jgi:hypothetical protein
VSLVEDNIEFVDVDEIFVERHSVEVDREIEER